MNSRNIFLGLFLALFFIQCSSDNNSTIAKLDGQSINYSSIDNLIQNQIYRNLHEIYYYRETTLNEVIRKKLMQKEASKLGISLDSLDQILMNKATRINIDSFIVAQDLLNGVPDPVNPFNFIDVNSAQGRKIVGNAIQELVRYEFYNALKTKSKIEIFLNPPPSPLIDLRNILMEEKGVPESEVVLTVITDIECSGCKYYQSLFDSLYLNLKTKIRFEYTHLTDASSYLALVAEFALHKNKLQEFCQSINENKITSYDSVGISAIALSIGINKSDIALNFNNKDFIKVEASKRKKLLIDAGILSTPTILINHRIYYGNLNFNSILNRIESY